jgi:hypothetical protein
VVICQCGRPARRGFGRRPTGEVGVSAEAIASVRYARSEASDAASGRPEELHIVTSLDQLAAQRPRDIDEALPCMQRLLEDYHEKNDYRAVFLRAYYVITVNLHAAVHQRGDYGSRIFFDGD